MSADGAVGNRTANVSRRLKLRWVIVALCVLAAVIWFSGKEEIRTGQPLEDARSATWRAGAYDATKNCGRFPKIGDGSPKYEFQSVWYCMPDGSVVMLIGYADDPGGPVTVRRISVYPDGRAFWRKDDEMESFDTDQLTPRRSLPFGILGWFQLARN